MGVSDVLMQIVTGETFIKMPEVISIRFTGRPPLGLGGKDIILGVLRQLKRNTVAAERLVEFCGEGLRYLSCDARFAICNMVTEFGGIGALVVPDAVTAEYIARRPGSRHKSDALYFKPDEDASYAGEYEINLSTLEHFVALFPSPDNVVSVSQAELPVLQGCLHQGMHNNGGRSYPRRPCASRGTEDGIEACTKRHASDDSRCLLEFRRIFTEWA